MFTEQYAADRLSLHCFALDLPLPPQDQIDLFFSKYAQKNLQRITELSEDADEEEELNAIIQEIEDHKTSNTTAASRSENQEQDDIFEIKESGRRLRVVCPLPEDLVGVWSRQPWWDAAIQQLPQLGWGVEDVTTRINNHSEQQHGQQPAGSWWGFERITPQQCIKEARPAKKDTQSQGTN